MNGGSDLNVVDDDLLRLKASGWAAAVQPRDFYLSPGMLQVMDKARPKSAHYFEVFNSAREFISGSVIYEVAEATSISSYVRPDLMLERIANKVERSVELEAGDVLPSAYVGCHQISPSRVVVNEEMSQGEILSSLNQMFDAVEELPLRSVCVPYVSETDYRLLDLLSQRGYVRLPNVEVASLSLPYTKFEEYLDHLSASRRSMVRRDRRKVRDAGVHVEVRGVEIADVEQLELLRAKHQEKYHGPAAAQLDWRTSVIAHAVQIQPGKSLMSVGTMDGRDVGFAFAYHDEDRLFVEQVGFDYAAINNVPLYFELVFYSFIEYALHSNTKYIFYSAESMDAKVSRGCSTDFLSAFILLKDQKAMSQVRSLASLAEFQGVVGR